MQVQWLRVSRGGRRNKADFQRLVRDEQGSVVLTAAGIVFLLLMLALTVDIGFIYIHRWRLVNACDAAALAAIQELPRYPRAAEEAAVQYFHSNIGGKAAVEVAIAPDNKKITVVGRKDVPTYFARLLGIDTVSIKVKSAASTGTMKKVTGLVPVAIPDQELIYGHQYVLKLGSPGSHIAPGVATSVVSGDFRVSGNFGAIALGGKGAHNYEMNLKYGYDTEINVGDVLLTEPGNMAGPTRRGVQYRLDQCRHVPRCTVDNYHRDCPRLVIVPVVAGFGNGRSEVTVLGFATFLLEETGEEGKGNNKSSYILGRFIRRMLPGEIGDGGDYGLAAYRLIE